MKANSNSDTKLTVVPVRGARSGLNFQIHNLAQTCAELGSAIAVDGSDGLISEAGIDDLGLEAGGLDHYFADLNRLLHSPRNAAMVWSRADDHVDPECWTALGLKQSDELSSVLAVPNALDFWRSIGIERAVQYQADTARSAAARCQELWGQTDTLAVPGDESSVLVALPDVLAADDVDLSKHLLREHGTKVSECVIDNKEYIQIKPAVYNTALDFELVVTAIKSAAAAAEARKPGAAEHEDGPTSCVVYRSDVRGMYLYVRNAGQVTAPTEQLADVLDVLVSVKPTGVQLDLTQDKKLGHGGRTGDLRKRLAKKGYFIARIAKDSNY